ncbi:MAG: aldehyde:ferredoxin oxidoreductase [Acidimicrobiia bacterium]|nr:MAG: aldehyde:ferredoxin oxidoreductase [Acidimicrobiia bacterium]
MPREEETTVTTAELQDLKPLTEFTVHRYHVDLTTKDVRFESIACTDLEDTLGGIARATKWFDGQEPVDPYSPEAPLMMNLGLLSGTRVMTGLRTYFHGWSPLKRARNGTPGLMWSAGSGHFGTKLRGLGIDDVIFTGRSETPVAVVLTMSEDPNGPEGPANFEFIDASDLVGRHSNDRIQHLHGRYPEAHFAVIGPAGEQGGDVRYAAIALSTDNQLKSGDSKARYAGRGGYGGVMGSKNLMAIIADGDDPGRQRGLRDLNKEINLGEGSRIYREIGTWRQMVTQGEHGIIPEFNFRPTGDDRHVALRRDPFEEAGGYEVRSESCYLCGIKCHKNIYDDDGEGRFRAKFDYEPLALLSVGLGIFDKEAAMDLIALCDELCMDSISLGVSLAYAMEWNRRNPGNPVADGLSYGDAAAALAAVEAIGTGKLPFVGQGTLRMAEELGAPEFAMQSKGVEYPAYVPHSNPGFPWALAGGHMSMRTFLLMIAEGETSVDYWVDAVTNRGWDYIRSDIDGLCKFSMATPAMHAEALQIAANLDIDEQALLDTTHRTFIRGYAVERKTGFDETDYVLPAEAHEPIESSELEYFNTPEFFAEMQGRILEELDGRARELGYL